MLSEGVGKGLYDGVDTIASRLGTAVGRVARIPWLGVQSAAGACWNAVLLENVGSEEVARIVGSSICGRMGLVI